MKDFWKKYREYVVIIAFLAVFFGVIRFGIIILLRRNMDMMNLLQEHLVDRKILEEESRQIPNMKAQAEIISAESGKLDVLLSQDDVVRLAESLETLGSTLNVSVSMEAAPDSAIALFTADEKKKSAVKKDGATDENEGASSETGAKKDSVPHLLPALPSDRTVFVIVKAIGSYPDIVRFAEKLDSAPTLLDILSVSIFPHEKEESSDEVSNRPMLFFRPPSSNTTGTPMPTLSDQEATVADAIQSDRVEGAFLVAVYLNQP